MIHQPSAGTRGKVTDMEIDLKEGIRLRSCYETTAKIWAKLKVKEDMERDYWMTAEQAKKYGLIDELSKSLTVCFSGPHNGVQ